MEPEEETVLRDGAQINGKTEGPRGSDNTNPDERLQSNLHRDEIEDSANGLDSVDVRGGQDGRNNRGFGGIDMDSKNGVIRMGDTDNSTMEVTEEGAANAAASIGQTKTSTVSVTTAGPDDYASDAQVNVPNAQEQAKKQDGDTGTEANDSDTNAAVSQEKENEDIAQTGTSIDHQPAY